MFLDLGRNPYKCFSFAILFDFFLVLLFFLIIRRILNGFRCYAAYQVVSKLNLCFQYAPVIFYKFIFFSLVIASD